MFLSSFKINRIAVCFFSGGLGICFRGFKKITELHLFFLIKLSFGPHTRNPFALEGYHWVMLSVYSCVFSVTFWSPLLMHVLRVDMYIIFFLPLFTTKSDTFFLLPHHHKKG